MKRKRLILNEIGDPPLCLNCKNFNKTVDDFTCSAYPEGIPMAIIQSSADHRLPLSGDNGIHYDPIDPDFPIPAELAAVPDSAINDLDPGFDKKEVDV